MIVMYVDTLNETLSFSGSDTGNASGGFEFGSYGIRFWTIPGSGLATSSEQIDLETLLQPNGMDSDATSINLISRYGGPGGSNYIDINVSSEEFLGGGDITSLVAVPSVTASYADWATAHKTQLEGFIGQSMVLIEGTGYSSIAIEAIPEPSMTGLMVGGFAGGVVFLAFSRRRRVS